MTNDESRMPKEIRIRHSSFIIRSDFVIRHSSFVIRHSSVALRRALKTAKNPFLFLPRFFFDCLWPYRSAADG